MLKYVQTVLKVSSVSLINKQIRVTHVDGIIFANLYLFRTYHHHHDLIHHIRKFLLGCKLTFQININITITDEVKKTKKVPNKRLSRFLIREERPLDRGEGVHCLDR